MLSLPNGEAGNIFDNILLDGELYEQCAPLLKVERYDAAVREAFTILETRLRESVQEVISPEVLNGRDTASDLIGKAFRSGDGPLARKLGLDASKGSALRELYSGTFGFYRNQVMHQRPAYGASTALEIIVLVGLLLRYLPKSLPAQQKIFTSIQDILVHEMPQTNGAFEIRIGKKNNLQIHFLDLEPSYELRFMKGERYIEVSLGLPTRQMLDYFKSRQREISTKVGSQVHLTRWSPIRARIYQKLVWRSPERASAPELAAAIFNFITATMGYLSKKGNVGVEPRRREPRPTDPDLGLQKLFVRWKTSPEIQATYKELIAQLREWNPEIKVRVGHKHIGVDSPERAFCSFTPKKSALEIACFARGLPVDGFTLKFLTGQPRWGRLQIKSRDEIQRALVLIKEAHRRLQDAIAANEKTQIWA